MSASSSSSAFSSDRFPSFPMDISPVGSAASSAYSSMSLDSSPDFDPQDPFNLRKEQHEQRKRELEHRGHEPEREAEASAEEDGADEAEEEHPDADERFHSTPTSSFAPAFPFSSRRSVSPELAPVPLAALPTPPPSHSRPTRLNLPSWRSLSRDSARSSSSDEDDWRNRQSTTMSPLTRPRLHRNTTTPPVPAPGATTSSSYFGTFPPAPAATASPPPPSESFERSISEIRSIRLPSPAPSPTPAHASDWDSLFDILNSRTPSPAGHQQHHRRPGGLGVSGRMRGPTRAANESWLGIGLSSSSATERREPSPALARPQTPLHGTHRARFVPLGPSRSSESPDRTSSRFAPFEQSRRATPPATPFFPSASSSTAAAPSASTSFSSTSSAARPQLPPLHLPAPTRTSRPQLASRLPDLFADVEDEDEDDPAPAPAPARQPAMLSAGREGRRWGDLIQQEAEEDARRRRFEPPPFVLPPLLGDLAHHPHRQPEPAVSVSDDSDEADLDLLNLVASRRAARFASLRSRHAGSAVRSTRIADDEDNDNDRDLPSHPPSPGGSAELFSSLLTSSPHRSSSFFSSLRHRRTSSSTSPANPPFSHPAPAPLSPTRRLFRTLLGRPSHSPSASNAIEFVPSYFGGLASYGYGYGGAVGDYMDDDELDLSYEGLLRLSEAIGEARPKGVSKECLDGLRSVDWGQWVREQGDTERRCPVCLEDYAPEDILTSLPGCAHAFHKSCIETWLGHSSKSCPVCRADVEAASAPAPRMPHHPPHAHPHPRTATTTANWREFGPRGL